MYSNHNNITGNTINKNRMVFREECDLLNIQKILHFILDF